MPWLHKNAITSFRSLVRRPSVLTQGQKVDRQTDMLSPNIALW